MSITEGVPASLVAGDRWQWRESGVAWLYPPDDGWTLRYRLVNEGGSIVITAIVVSGVYEVDVDTPTTAAYAAGEYAWTAWVERPGDRRTVRSGRVEIMPDPAAATGDIRTHAERVLEAIRAVIEGRATKDQESYSIAGRSLSRTPLSDLLELERRYAARVAAERAERERAAGRGGSSTISITFGRI